MLGAAFVLSALPADAYQPVLHEFIPPDDGEDLALSLTTAEGDLPAAIDTRSGVVRAPETQRSPSPSESAYREPLLAIPVRLPARSRHQAPSMVRYEDPFSPSIAPYKRLHAYDAVGPDYTLRVRDASLTHVPMGGTARVGEEEFYADLTVDFAASSTVLIPSVGPGARILAQHVTPAIPIDVWRDGADNWYAKAPASQRGRVHLVMQVAIARAAFGGEFTMPSWSGLSGVAPLPAGAARAFSKVRDALGLTRDISPAENLRKLVTYFRSFSPSDDASASPTGRRRHLPRPHALPKRSLSSPRLRLSRHRSRSWYSGANGHQRSPRLGRGPDRSNVATDRSRRRRRRDRRRDLRFARQLRSPRPTRSAGLPRPRADRDAK